MDPPPPTSRLRQLRDDLRRDPAFRATFFATVIVPAALLLGIVALVLRSILGG